MRKLTRSILLIGSSFEASDVQYASGFKALDPVVYLQRGARRYLVVPPLEVGRARKEAPRTKIISLDDLSLRRGRRGLLSEWIRALLAQQRTRRVTVSDSFPHGLARQLARAGIHVYVQDGRIFPQREIKSPREIARLIEAQRAAVAAMKTAVRRIASARPGRDGYLRRGRRKLTAEDVRIEIETTLLRYQTFARDTIVAGGDQAVDPHERGHGPLRAGEPIVIDIFPQHKTHGYWGDITRTVIKGAPRPALKRMYVAVLTAQRAALAMLKPGVNTADIHARVIRIFEQHGFQNKTRRGRPEGFFHGTGHGVGLDIHEAPSVSVRPTRLKAGHVITIEPGLYYRGLGGIRVEDTVVITRRGWRHLAACPHVFEV